MSEKNKEKFWLFAFRDHLANLRTFQNGLESVDVDGSGDFKLLVADGKKSLRTFSGTSQLRETRLPSIPSAITSISMPKISRRYPVVAVAVGCTILMFANEKPLYRYNLPPVEVDPEERSIWEMMIAKEISVSEGIAMLQTKLEQGCQATPRTLDLLLLDNPRECDTFVAEATATPLEPLDTITCMTSIAFGEEGPSTGPSSLVIGTERRLVYVLNVGCTEVLLKVELPSPPADFIVAGSFTSDYRIVVSCRHGHIYSIKNGALASHVIHPDGAVCGMARYDNQIVVATVANTVTYFSLKGKRHTTLYFRQAVTNLVTITDPATGSARGLVIGFSDGELRVYVGKTLCHTSNTFAPTTALAFGRYGREESALIAVLQNGSLLVQLLHRNALLEVRRGDDVMPAAEQDIPIPVPRLSSIFKTQTERESANGANIYRSFQYDLCHLRLVTARKYMEIHNLGGVSGLPSGNGGTLSLPNRKIRLSSTVQGLGPVFKIRVDIESQSPAPEARLLLLFSFDPLIYHMSESMCTIPYLIKNQRRTCRSVIRVLDGEAGGEPVKVFILRAESQEPVTSLVIELPEKEFVECM